MATIELDLEIQYVQCLLADARVESKPVLRVYFDGHFVRSEAEGGIWTLPLDERRLDKTYRRTIRARTDQPIPLTACVGIAACAQRRNEFGMACATTAGTTHLRMADVIQMHKDGKERELPLLLETTRMLGDPVSKGVISVRVHNVRMGRSARFIPMEQCLLGDGSLANCNEELTAFLERRIQFENALRDTWPGIKNVRAPMNISASGIELTKACFVPIEGFAIVDPIEMNAGYFQNAMERAMIRRNLNPETDYDTLDLAHKAELMAELFVYAQQSFDYIGDTFEASVRKQPTKELRNLIAANTYDPRLKKSFEDFSNGGVRKASDCEDGSKFAQVCKDAFDRLDLNVSHHSVASSIGSSSGSRINYERLAELQEISSHYNYFMTLATVHGAKAEDNTEHIGAHMYGLLLPKNQVRRALRTNAIGKAMAERLSLGSAEGQTIDLPTLFAEGTGRIRPMGEGPVVTIKHMVQSAVAAGLIGHSSNHPATKSYDPLIEARRYVATHLGRSRGGLKMEIPHDYGAPSSFYLGNLLVVTNDYMAQGHPIGAFICGTIDPKLGGGITRGAHFVDIINQHPNFALIPCEPLPERIMSITREAAMLSEPCPPYTYDASAPRAGPPNGKEPNLERLKQSINGLGRHGISPHGSVDIWMRPHQFNAASLELMASEIRSAPGIWKVDYAIEYITNQTYTYQVRLFVDQEHLEEE